MNLFANRRRLLTVTGFAGIGYALSWIAGLSVPAPSPKLTASGAQIAAALAGHGTAVATQFALTEGLPAAGLAIVSIALARAARRSRAATAARAALIAGVAAALISLTQFVLGAVLAATSAPATAHLLYDAVNRLDGVKMLALAILGLAAASWVLPRWLRYTGIALAITITASGVAYLLLLQNLANLAIPAGVLLLVFITGTGITLGTSAGKPPPRRPCRPQGTTTEGSGMTRIDFNDGSAMLVRAADAEIIGFARQTVQLAADSSSKGGRLSTQRVTLLRAAAGPHHHANSAELFDVLSGSVQLLAGDRLHVAGEGDLAVVPSGLRHAVAVAPASDSLLDFPALLIGRPNIAKSAHPVGSKHFEPSVDGPVPDDVVRLIHPVTPSTSVLPGQTRRGVTRVRRTPDAMKERGLLAPRSCPESSCSGCLRHLRRWEAPCGRVRRPADRGHGPAPPPVGAGEDGRGWPEAGDRADRQQPGAADGGDQAGGPAAQGGAGGLLRLVLGGGHAGGGRRGGAPGAPAGHEGNANGLGLTRAPCRCWRGLAGVGVSGGADDHRLGDRRAGSAAGLSRASR